MTVAADLALREGALRRYLLKIDGLPYVLNQRVADPTGNDAPLSDGDSTVAGYRSTLAPLDADIIACYRLNETSASADAVDASGNGHTAAQTGDPAVVAAGMFGGARRAASTVATATSGDRFTVADHSDFKPAAAVTLCAWVYLESVSQYLSFQGSVAGKLWSGTIANQDYSYGLQLYNGGSGQHAWRAMVRLDTGGTGTAKYATQATNAALGWTFLCLTWDGATLTLYVNGAAVDTATSATANILYSSESFEIGNDFNSLVGYQDDVAVYSTAKSAEWVADVYSGGVGGLNCLRAPKSEATTSLDLGTMKVEASSMTFELDDIDDPNDDGKSFFGKLFAPSRWSGSTVNRTYLKRTALASTQLDADATTIACTKTAAFDLLPASGKVYLGGEVASYTAKNTTNTTTTGGFLLETLGTLTGVSKGLYPAITEPRGTSTTTWGRTFEYQRIPEMTAGDVGAHMPIADEPYWFVGRTVALYVTTYDVATATWNSVANARLLWAGTVAESIAFDPSTGAWSLNCEHILGSLERPLAAHRPTAMGAKINLNGTLGRDFIASSWTVYDPGGTDEPYWYCIAYRVCTVAAGYYADGLHVAQAVAEQLSGSWKINVDGSVWTTALDWTFTHDAGKISLVCLDVGSAKAFRFVIYTSLADLIDVPTTDYDSPYKTLQHPARPCHAFLAMGFDVVRPLEFGIDDTHGLGSASITADRPYATAYQPLHPDFNGGVLLVEQRGTDYLWSTQGDYEAAGGSAYAVVMAEGAVDRGVEANAVLAYSAQSTAERKLQLALVEHAQQPRRYMPGSYIADEVNGEPLRWQNVWIPKATDANGAPVGPVRQLMPSLLSTGTTHYNDANYDHAPHALSCCIPSALIDKPSFLLADAQIRAAYPASSLRTLTVVDGGTSWMDLWLREARAYGYAVVWDTALGKIACRAIIGADAQSPTAALTESNTASPDDFPVITMSVGTVINRWDCKIGHGIDGKNPRQITINDRESIEGLDGIVKSAKLDHPGIRPHIHTLSAIVGELQASLMRASVICRYPLQRIRRSLSPTLLGLVSVGDIVTVTYSYGYQDPGGTGARTLSSSALVLDIAWTLETGAGTCDLLIIPPGARPWAPAALVDITASNAGWASGTKTLTLVANAFGQATDTHDGVALGVDGYKLLLINRGAEDPTSITPVAMTAASYTTGTKALVIDEDITASFDTTGDTEYVVVCADWGTAVTAQRLIGTWQAGNTSHVLGTDDQAHIYG